MAPDQPEPDHAAAPAIQVLIVDPDAVRSAARRLDDLPGPGGPAAAPPSAAEVGQRGLTEEIAEFDQLHRAVESALVTDTEGAIAQLGEAAERYRRADDETASQLIELQDALSRRPGPDCSYDTDENDHNDGDRDDRDRDDGDDDHDRDRDHRDHDHDDHDRGHDDDRGHEHPDRHDDHRDSRSVYEV